MSIKLIAVASAVAAAALLASCQSIPDKTSLADYCATADHANKDVCKVNVEIDGQKTALASTNMSLSEARAIADKAMATAETAQQTALTAQHTAEQAANTPLTCETKTFRRSKTGSCSPGYKLVSCTQTHYTTRAGGVSIMRSIDDAQCTFQTKVLEIAARCCADGQPPVTDVSTPAPSEPAPESPATSS